jgi:hypothetical protein
VHVGDGVRRVQQPTILLPEHLDLLKQNFHRDTGREKQIKIGVETQNGCRIAKPIIDALIKAVRDQQIDVVIIDPFVSSHSIRENDNVNIDRVIKEGWVHVAEEGNCGVDLVHHTRKGTGGDISAADARGATAIVNAARDVRVFNPMSADEAKTYDVGLDVWRYFRIESDKANMAARGGVTPWRYLESVGLDNAADGRPSDDVGVVIAWEPPTDTPEQAKAKTEKLTADILALVDAGKRITRTGGGDMTIRRLASKLRLVPKVVEAELERLCDEKVLVYRSNAAGGHGAAGYYRVVLD